MAVIGAVLATASLVVGPDPQRQGRHTLMELGARLSALREQAVLLDRHYGVALSEGRWQAMGLHEGTWVALEPTGILVDNLAWQLKVGGQPVPLPTTVPSAPQLLALASDELSEFELSLQMNAERIGVLHSDGARDPEVKP